MGWLWAFLQRFPRVTLGIFTVMFQSSTGCIWDGFGQFSAIFGVTVGINTVMFQSSTGEIWDGFGHFSAIFGVVLDIFTGMF